MSLCKSCDGGKLITKIGFYICRTTNSENDMHFLARGILHLSDSIYVACVVIFCHMFSHILSQITRTVYLIASKKQRFISSQISSKRFSAMCNLSCNTVYFIASRLLFGHGLCVLLCIALGGWNNTSPTYTFLFYALSTRKFVLPNIFISCIFSILWLLTSLLHTLLFFYF